MESTEAIAVLARAGRGDEAREVVDRATERAQQRYREVAADESRTPDFKQAELNRIYEQVRADVNGKLASLAQSSAQAEQSDAIRMFGTAGLPGDPASLVISRRDAADRVAKLQNRQELQELLTRANRTGDEVLARAVAEKALEHGDSDLLNAFLADRPQLQPVGQRLWDAARAGGGRTDTLQYTMLLSGLRPPQPSFR